MLVAFKLAGYMPQSLQTCQEEVGGFFGYTCSDDVSCLRVEELGNGYPGYLTAFDVPESVNAIHNRQLRKIARRTR
jgi:hypothetical protein